MVGFRGGEGGAVLLLLGAELLVGGTVKEWKKSWLSEGRGNARREPDLGEGLCCRALRKLRGGRLEPKVATRLRRKRVLRVIKLKRGEVMMPSCE